MGRDGWNVEEGGGGGGSERELWRARGRGSA